LKWLNHHLKSDEEIKDLYKSMRDGLLLISALEKCTGESIGKYNKRVMMDIQRCDNIDVCLRFLKSKKIVQGSNINPKGFKVFKV
jgi:hypothetical protein